MTQCNLIFKKKLAQKQAIKDLENGDNYVFVLLYGNRPIYDIRAHMNF